MRGQASVIPFLGSGISMDLPNRLLRVQGDLHAYSIAPHLPPELAARARAALPLAIRIVASLLLLSVAGLGARGARLPAGSGSVAAARADAPPPASDEDAIRQLLVLEGDGILAQDLAGLMGLWAVDAVVTDAKHTPQVPDDDAHWRGRHSIRTRYEKTVLPSAPFEAGNLDVKISVAGKRATATSTTRIGHEVSPGGDTWTFVKRNGRWWIASLTYNLEKE